MRHIKTLIGAIILGITLCGCGSSTVTSEISVNDSKQEVTTLKSGNVYINDKGMRTLVVYEDNLEIKEFIPTHAVYLKMSNYSFSGPLIGPNGYNCLYNDDGYIYESTTNVIVYDFR